MWEAADGETGTGQRLQVMELFQVTIADMTTRFMTFPDEAGVTGFSKPSGCLIKGGIPTPGVGARHPNALLEEIHRPLVTHATPPTHKVTIAIGTARSGIDQTVTL